MAYVVYRRGSTTTAAGPTTSISRLTKQVYSLHTTACKLTSKCRKGTHSHHLQQPLALVKIDLEAIGYAADHRSVDDEKMMNTFDLFLLEKKDLSAISSLALNGFYKSNFESWLDVADDDDDDDDDNDKATGGRDVRRGSLWDAFIRYLMWSERLDMYLSNYLGFWNRSGLRLQHPSLDMSHDSIILVAKMRPHLNDTDTSAIIGVIELGLEVPNGLLSPPLRNPFRGLFRQDSLSSELDRKQAYLCNLCVDAEYRRLGIGRFLCKVVEHIACSVWGKGYMGLHVEKSNGSAQKLYTELQYMECDLLSAREKRINGLENILYYAKPL